MTVLLSVLLLGWAAVLPIGTRTQWWHYLAVAAIMVAFLGSWHGQHLSTTVRRWVPLARYNRRLRTHRAQSRRNDDAQASEPPTAGSGTLHARIVIHLRPQPHGLTTPADVSDQMPWRFVASWLNRYGVRADDLTVTSVTRTPPASGLRADAAALLTRPQHRDTWLTYSLSAEQNVGALTARRTTMGSSSETSDIPQSATLAETTARRLVAELREQGWLATLVDSDAPLAQFVPPAATIRRETWTATEYSDGYRALYSVAPGALASVLPLLSTLGTKALWVSVRISSRGNQPRALAACVGTVTGAQPGRRPVPGVVGFHGRHRQVAAALTATGLAQPVPTEPVRPEDLTALCWPTSAPGVPIGYNRSRQPVYLGLSSPEPVRITVTGSAEFQIGIVASLARCGLPIALYLRDVRPWAALANHAAPQQFSVAPATVPAGGIVVTDGTGEVPASAITVTLRRPQASEAPATTIVITQDRTHRQLFRITAGQSRQLLSTHLVDATPRR